MDIVYLSLVPTTAHAELHNIP